MDGLNKIKKSLLSLKWYEVLMIVIMIAISVYYVITPNQNPVWLSVLNLISGISGVVCVFLTAKVNRINFPFACVNTATYIVYLWYWKIYGTMTLELLFYAPMNIISWIQWYRHKDEEDKLLTKSKKLSLWQMLLIGLLIGVGTVIYHSVLIKIGGNVAWLDACTFAIGIIAIFMELLRYREQYYLWLITDIVAVAMYIIHFDPVYLCKKTIYLIEAFIGLYNWIQCSKKNKGNE